MTTKPKITIRKATMKDLFLIQDLNYRLFEFEHKNFDSGLRLEWSFDEKGLEYFEFVIKKQFAVLAFDDKTAVGYMTGHIPKTPSYNRTKFASWDNIIVDEKYRKLGVGKMLFSAFTEFCAKKKIHTIRVSAYSQNKIASKFYKSLGFTEYITTFSCDI